MASVTSLTKRGVVSTLVTTCAEFSHEVDKLHFNLVRFGIYCNKFSNVVCIKDYNPTSYVKILVNKCISCKDGHTLTIKTCPIARRRSPKAHTLQLGHFRHEYGTKIHYFYFKTQLIIYSVVLAVHYGLLAVHYFAQASIIFQILNAVHYFSINSSTH